MRTVFERPFSTKCPTNWVTCLFARYSKTPLTGLNMPNVSIVSYCLKRSWDICIGTIMMLPKSTACAGLMQVLRCVQHLGRLYPWETAAIFNIQTRKYLSDIIRIRQIWSNLAFPKEKSVVKNTYLIRVPCFFRALWVALRGSWIIISVLHLAVDTWTPIKRVFTAESFQHSI